MERRRTRCNTLGGASNGERRKTRALTSPALESEIMDNGPLTKLQQAIKMLNEAASQLGAANGGSTPHAEHSRGSLNPMKPMPTARSDNRGSMTPLKTMTASPTGRSVVSHRERASTGEQPVEETRSRFSTPAIDNNNSNIPASGCPKEEEIKLLPRWQYLDDDRVHASYLQCMEMRFAFTMKDSFRPSLQGDTIERIGAFNCLRWAIHPQSRQRIVWDVLSVLFITWDLLWVPLHTFDLSSLARLLDITDWCVTIFWTLDIVMSFRTGFYKKQSIDLRARNIAIRYAKSWMAADMGIVAFEWVTLFEEDMFGASAARVNRLRVVARYIRGARSLKLANFGNKLKAGARSFHLLVGFSLLKIILGLTVVCHYLACGWHFAGSRSSDGWVFKEDETGRQPAAGDKFITFIYLYTSAARWTLAQINGRTDLAKDRNMIERMYTVCVAFFTVVFYSLFISALTTKMVELLGVRAEVQKGMRLLNAFVHRHRLSRSTVYFARRYVANHQTMKNEAGTEAALLDLLPDHLQWDLMYEVRSPTLIRHFFMKDLDRNFKSAFRHMLATTISNVYTRVLEVVFEPAMPCGRVLFHTEGQLRYELESNYKVAIRERALENPREPTARLRKAATRVLHRSNAEESLEFGQEVPITACLSEAAFWIEWHHKGALVATAESHLLAMDVDKFSAGLVHHVDAEARAAVYAFSFVVKMRKCRVLDLMENDFGSLCFDFDNDDETMTARTVSEKAPDDSKSNVSFSHFASLISSEKSRATLRNFHVESDGECSQISEDRITVQNNVSLATNATRTVYFDVDNSSSSGETSESLMEAEVVDCSPTTLIEEAEDQNAALKTQHNDSTYRI